MTLTCALVLEVTLSTYAYAKTPTQQSANSDLSIPTQYANQKVTWTKCGEGETQCTTVTAPMDWTHPNNGDTVTLALKKYPSTRPTEPKHNVLFFNPGGPGSSGINYLDRTISRFPQDLRQSFDIVTWDPRGVGKSTPIDCLTAKEIDEFLENWSDPSTNEGIAARQKVTKQLADTCSKSAGKLLEHVSTTETVSDLNLLRHLLDQNKLNYLGLSYGTRIGALYADTYPTKTGRMLLDGSVDPTLTQYDHDLMQMRSFEKAITNYLDKHCENIICPFVLKEDIESPSLEVKKQRFREWLEDLAKKPLKTDTKRDLTLSLAYYGIILPLYSDDWYFLSIGLEQAVQEHDGSLLLSFAEDYAGREDDGSYSSNTMQAYWAITCSDQDRYGAEQGRVMSKQLKQEGGTIGPLMAGMENVCEFWPGKESGSKQVKPYMGSDPILMIGAKGDPVTPINWSRSLKEQFGSGARLLTVVSDSHTSVLTNKCVQDATATYFLDGVVPKEGSECN